LSDQRRERDRRKPGRRSAPPASPVRPDGVEAHGWTILAHPLFLTQIEKLTAAAEAERRGARTAPPGPNAKLLGHLLDLAFDRIPRDPGNAAYRHGGTLGENRRHWFRGRTGNGRYRLFYRFQSSARLLVYAWVNDEQSLRTYGSNTDAYAVFARMLDGGNPPDDWEALLAAAAKPEALNRLRGMSSGAQGPSPGC
jgi:toxin YhaV